MSIKGNIIIGQSGGPTAVINSSLAGAIEASKDAGIKKIYGMHYGIEGFLNDNIIDLRKQVKNAQDVSLLKRTPSAFLGSCRYKLPKIEGNEEVYEKIFAILEKYDIQYFLYNGGNDSMDTVKMLSDYMKEHGIDGIVKGYRDEKDLEWENYQAEYNKEHGGFETVLLQCRAELAHVSSTLVRRRLDAGEEIDDLVSEGVAEFIQTIKR